MVACGWFWIDYSNGFEPNSWIVRQNLTEESVLYQYISATYWTFQTLTTVGYGDIPAVTWYEKLYAITWMLLGFCFYTYTIGNF